MNLQASGKEQEVKQLLQRNEQLEEEVRVLRTRVNRGESAQGLSASVSKASDDVRSVPGDDDVRSVRSSVSAASEQLSSPELCGVGMRLTNVAPHRVLLPPLICTLCLRSVLFWLTRMCECAGGEFPGERPYWEVWHGGDR